MNQVILKRDEFLQWIVFLENHEIIFHYDKKILLYKNISFLIHPYTNQIEFIFN